MAGPGRKLPDEVFLGGVVSGLVLLYFVSRRDVGLIEGLKVLGGGILLIGIVIAVAWVAWYLWNRPTTPTALELSRRLEAVRSMDGTQFEVFVADLLRAMRYRVTLVGGVGDQGVDIIVNAGGERVAVQCKNHSMPVGNKAVQEVYAGARYHRCVEAWVVAPSGYTRGARDLAKGTSVSLYDADSMREWISKVDRLERELATQSETKQHSQNNPRSKEIAEARKRAVWHPHPDDPPRD